eukprot:1156402-Pelagomonas_calceolata.AAC.4
MEQLQFCFQSRSGMLSALAHRTCAHGVGPQICPTIASKPRAACFLHTTRACVHVMCAHVPAPSAPPVEELPASCTCPPHRSS